LIAAATPPVAALAPFIAAVCYIIQRVYLRTSRQVRLMDLEAKAPLCTHFLETLAGITTIRAFGWSAKYRQRSDELLDTSQVPFYLLSAIQNWLKLVLELMVAGIVTVVVGVAVALRDKVDAGFLGLALVGVMDLGFTLSYFVTAWTGLETSLSAISRVRSFALDTPKEEDETNEAIHTAPDWPIVGTVSYHNFTASYSAEGETVLKDVCLDIKDGEKVGICGRTGSGKSSLVASLFGLLHQKSGSIEIDHVGTTSVSLETLRSKIVALPQEPFFLTNSSVRSNMRPWIGYSTRQVVSDELLIQALEDVGLWRRLIEICGEHDGSVLDASMRDVEGSFSQGEKQLFCLARATVTEGKIVVLDEATSRSVNALFLYFPNPPSILWCLELS
jgi:ATP-binding cassette subfamily C (CFTR/MRP) protein 1